MKKILISLIALAMAFSSQAFDLKGMLGGGKTSDDQTTQSGGLGDILGGIVGSIVGTTNFNIDDLVGTWSYKSPAVTLASDNALQKIGGAAATSAIEKKLEPYYKTAGLTNIELTVDADHNFTMKLRAVTLTGTIEKSDEEGLIFNFKAFNKINIGKVKTMAEKQGNNLTLTFDVSKLKSVVEKAASLSGNTTIQGMSALLGSYDGMFAGFRLAKQK